MYAWELFARPKLRSVDRETKMSTLATGDDPGAEGIKDVVLG